MIVSLRPMAVLRRAIPRPMRAAWRARRAEKNPPSEARQFRPKVGFFRAYQEMLEHQSELMIRLLDR